MKAFCKRFLSIGLGPHSPGPHKQTTIFGIRHKKNIPQTQLSPNNSLNLNHILEQIWSWLPRPRKLAANIYLSEGKYLSWCKQTLGPGANKTYFPLPDWMEKKLSSNLVTGHSQHSHHLARSKGKKGNVQEPRLLPTQVPSPLWHP